MIQIKPPSPLPRRDGTVDAQKLSIFLAGSIEQGTAEDWQAKVAEALADKDVVLLNPRRDHWDANLQQSITNPVFRGQVEWELDALGESDWIIMYFDPATKSPITLLEFGMWVNSRKLLTGFKETFQIPAEVELIWMRALDKLDRLGKQGVALLLGQGRKDESGDFTRGAGLTDVQIEALLLGGMPDFEVRLPALRVGDATREIAPIRFERRRFDGGIEPFNC